MHSKAYAHTWCDLLIDACAVLRMAAGLGGTTAELAQTDAVAKSLADAAGESEFWAVEQLAWGDADVAEVYQQSFNNLTGQCIPVLLDGVGCDAGTRLLDVATGPGYVLLSALVSCHSRSVCSTAERVSSQA